MYLTLNSDEAAMNASFTPINESSVSLIRGRLIDAADEELPFRFSYRAPAEGSLFDFYSADNLMSRKLVAALEAAGVDNLQKFETELVEEQTGKTRNDYWTVNVVGLFVDADKANGALMFRLKQSMSDIVIHEKVADAVKAGGFHGVVLAPG